MSEKVDNFSKIFTFSINDQFEWSDEFAPLQPSINACKIICMLNDNFAITYIIYFITYNVDTESDGFDACATVLD